MSASDDIFIRNKMLYGEKGFAQLQKSFVAVVGLGGVGSHAAEALARAGIGRLRIIDCDSIKPSDVNRQNIALTTTIGLPKTEAARDRLLAIHPGLQLDTCQAFFHFDTARELITPDLDFVMDAIDSLNPKGELIRHCTTLGIPIISALGAGGRTDPFQIKIARLDETSICPLAKALRRHLRTKGISTDIPVIYSTETPVTASAAAQDTTIETTGTYIRGRPRSPVPSLPTIPAIFGLAGANYVILELLKKCG
jgi:tRNA threonylcarbamoyladenosine dehydratase